MGYSRFWGLLMFGTFSIINIIVLLNLLIAMMNHSYQLISVSSVSVTRAVVTRSRSSAPVHTEYRGGRLSLEV